MTRINGAAQQLALLVSMLTDDDRPDPRSQQQIDAESTAHNEAERRKDARMNPSESDSEWAARKRSA